MHIRWGADAVAEHRVTLAPTHDSRRGCPLCVSALPLVLVPSRRPLVLAGLALYCLAEVALAYVRPGRPPSARAALGVIGLVGLFLSSPSLIEPRPELVPLAILLSLRRSAPPLGFCAAHRSQAPPRKVGESGRLLPLYGVLHGTLRSRACVGALVRVRELELGAAAPRDSPGRSGRFARSRPSRPAGRRADAPAHENSTHGRAAFAVVARSPFPAWMPRALGIAAVARLRGPLPRRPRRGRRRSASSIDTPSVQIGKAYSSFFRTTSLFRDPSLYGRHLVLAIAIVLTAALVPEARDRYRGDCHRCFSVRRVSSSRRKSCVSWRSSPSPSSSRLLRATGPSGSPQPSTAVRGWRRFRRRQGRGRLDPEGDQRPLASDRPDRRAADDASPPWRSGRSTRAVAGHPLGRGARDLVGDESAATREHEDGGRGCGDPDGAVARATEMKTATAKSATRLDCE